MARDVADACLLLAAMAGHHPADPFSRGLGPEEFLSPAAVDLCSVRVAFSEDLGFALVDRRLRETFRQRVADLRHLFRQSIMAHPENPHGNDLYELLRSITAVATLEKYVNNHRDLLGENNITMYEKGRRLTGDTIAWATAEQTRVFHRFEAFFQDHDLLITPTVGVPPHSIHDLYVKEVDGEPTRTFMHTLALTYGITVVGLPAISIPCGLEPTGTPFHLQLVAGPGKDRFLLGAAHSLFEYMAAFQHLKRPRPSLEQLVA
jgi:Asp-tRNA(Asn)/Glu-tRNA(Gln) amidotransferase A subunit family amidase